MDIPLVDDKELKNCIGSAMQNVYGHVDQSTLSAAMSCVKKRMDKEKTTSECVLCKILISNFNIDFYLILCFFLIVI